MKRLYVFTLIVVFFIVLAVPVMADSHMVLAKKHMGPVPFPPDIIPTISHKHAVDKNHNETLNK